MRGKGLTGILSLLGASMILGAGFVARTQASYEARSEASVAFSDEPTLVEIDGGVWVVREREEKKGGKR